MFRAPFVPWLFMCNANQSMKYYLIFFFLFLELQAMSMRLVSGGTYNVRASEMAAHIQDTRPKTVTCVVHFLDDSQEVFEVDVSVCIYEFQL